MKRNITLDILTGVFLVWFIGLEVIQILDQKAFWLDEWFIIWNIKFRDYAGLFSQLDFIQQFPKVYLSIIKGFVAICSSSYLSYRLIPFLVQVGNLFLIWRIISPKLFPRNYIKRTLFVFIVLSNIITLHYFSQLKQYGMELMMANIAILQFLYIKKCSTDPPLKIKSSLRLLSISLFFVPFFSYTYAFVSAPIWLILLLLSIEHKRYITPLLSLSLAFILLYAIDLRFALSNHNQYANLAEFIFNRHAPLHGIKNIFRFLSINFSYQHDICPLFLLRSFVLIRITLVALILITLTVTLHRGVKKLNKKMPSLKLLTSSFDLKTYFLLTTFTILIFYILGLIPLGVYRLNYFSAIMLAYLSIEGADLLSKKTKLAIIKPIGFTILALTIGIQAYDKDSFSSLGHESFFDHTIYQNIGVAIQSAEQNNCPIYAIQNSFYPETIMENIEELVIKSHHNYHPEKEINVHIVPSNTLIEDKKYIFLRKNDYQLIQSKE